MRFPRKSVLCFTFVFMTIMPGEDVRRPDLINIMNLQSSIQPAVEMHFPHWEIDISIWLRSHKTAAHCYTVHRDTHHSSGNKQTRKMVDILLYLVDRPVAIDRVTTPRLAPCPLWWWSVVTMLWPAPALPLLTTASNEGSQRFHNHGEGPY